MLTLTKPQSKSHVWKCHCFFDDIVTQYVQPLGMQIRHKPLTTGLFCTFSVLRAVCPRLEMRMQQNQFVIILHCTHRRQDDWQVKSTIRWCAPSASSGSPSKVAFLKKKYSTSQYHLTGYICSLFSSQYFRHLQGHSCRKVLSFWQVCSMVEHIKWAF